MVYNAVVKVNKVKSVSKQKIYDAFFSDDYGNIPRSFMSRLSNARWASMLDTPGFFHDTNGYTLSLEVPGYVKENIKVEVDPANRILALTVTNYRDVEEGEIVLQKRLSIPIGADVSKDPKAKLELGILSVTFPEDVATQPRIIEVTVE